MVQLRNSIITLTSILVIYYHNYIVNNVHIKINQTPKPPLT